METQQAFKVLGLIGNESVSDINAAYQTKLNLVEEKTQAAPTEALKQKFEQFKTELKQAHKLLLAQYQQNAEQRQTENNQPHSQSSSPLSQTKTHDLPGAQATTDTALEVGTVLAERYQIKAFIAQGGMGAVYRAFDKNRNQDIAIKVMLPQLMQNESARERFLDEARLSSQLSHPNIVNVFDVIQDNDLCFLTMELLEGQDLRQLMDNRKLVRKDFTLDDIIEILEPICAGLDHAHELTVHRDIKPENIYLTEDGKYKLMDFGIARIMSTSQRTQTGAASGTAYYMAPEQLKGAKNIDGRADQYALAVLTYELLSGEVPAGAIEPLHELVKGINKKVSQNVQKALSPKPENRFDNLTEFLTALKGKSKGSGISMPTLPMKGIGIATAIVIVILGVGGVASTGGLTSLWEAIKPVDKELIAQQKATELHILNDKKAEVAKLQGEIKNYQKRLSNGQRNLKSGIRDAERKESKELKYLQHWQRLTDDYLFDGDEVIELEGEFSKGDSLLKQNTTTSIQQATSTLTQVRDGYKNLWAQFNGAENLLKTQEQSTLAFNKWEKRKSHYAFDEPKPALEAKVNTEQATVYQREGDFDQASKELAQAERYWKDAYRAMDTLVVKIEHDKERALTEKKRIEKEQKLAKERKRLAKIAAEKLNEITKQVNIIEDMVSIPEGRFLMGCVSQIKCEKNMMSSRFITLKAFYMNATEITFSQWGACVSDGGCKHDPYLVYSGVKTPPELFNQPVFHVSYDDITQQFIPWLNKKTNKSYRLPSEAEWEYAARAGTHTIFSWGNSINCSRARYGFFGKQCGKPESPVAVKSYPPNDFGLYDMHGNVSEWTEDCWNLKASTNGQASTTGDCTQRVQRGGSHQSKGLWIRSAGRSKSAKNERLLNSYGFRLVRDK
jgi:serine/threonine protein kinase/formylglycine-generating enzyme required for sulfatase activity